MTPARPHFWWKTQEAVAPQKARRQEGEMGAPAGAGTAEHGPGRLAGPSVRPQPTAKPKKISWRRQW